MFAQDIKKFIVRWNDLYPIDYVWRKKYNIPFGSEKHKEVDFIDMLVDFEEQLMVEKSLRGGESDEDDNLLLDGRKVVKMTKQEIDDDFDNLDVSKYN